jgi:hypothetical protein
MTVLPSRTWDGRPIERRALVRSALRGFDGAGDAEGG